MTTHEGRFQPTHAALKDPRFWIDTPRTLHCHEHVAKKVTTAAAATDDDVIGNDYPACALAGAKEVERKTPAQQKTFIEAREQACEKWLDEMAMCINVRHSVPATLAFQTFAPSTKEPLSAIFAKYSGAPQ